MWKEYGRAGQTTDDNIIRRMNIACGITKATDTHSECIVLLAPRRQQWLHERALMFRLYVDCLPCLVAMFKVMLSDIAADKSGPQNTLCNEKPIILTVVYCNLCYVQSN
jgi:hypothetical protein